MRWLLQRETWTPWLFFGLGYSLIHWHQLVIDDLLHARGWSFLLFPHNQAFQYFFMGLVVLALLPAFGLCLITGWGLRRRASWARWTGLFPCVYLLFGFPWLTLVGAGGLYLLWTQPVESVHRPIEFWNPRRQSIWFAIASVLGWAAVRQGITVFEAYADRIGLPDLEMDRTPLLALFLLVWLHIGVHECGHALAAWAVGFRLKAFGIGPLALHKDEKGIHFRFEWRLLLTGGYTGAVPTSAEGIWRKQIVVVAAGPFASFAAGAAFIGLFFLAPETPLAALWHDLAIGSLLGFYIGALNLIPIGYTDGTMLLHLILRTRRGEELIAKCLDSQIWQAADDRNAAIDYKGCAALKRTALERLLEQGEADPARLAEEYLGLGRMEVAAEQWREAEQHLRQALDLLAKGEPKASRESTCWACLHRIYLRRRDLAGAEEAYRKALATNESLRPTMSSQSARLTLSFCIAELHVHAHAFEPALAETERALDGFPDRRELRFLKGRLLSIRAHSALQSGHVAMGLAAAEEAAAIFRSEQITGGAAALQQLGLLGWSLWEGGQTKQATALYIECIRVLEQLGAMDLATRCRLGLAHILRSDGRTAEAACVLPRLERVGRDLRKEYLAQRGATRQKAGRWADALRDASEILSLAVEEEPADELAISIARSTLAEAYLDAGLVAEAEATALQAYAELVPSGHPERAAACVTLALVGWQNEGSTGVYLEEAMQVWTEASLILAADRAHFLESTADRLERAGVVGEAARWRDAAEGHWRKLGVRDPNAVSAGRERALAQVAG
jgi:tetratricopeptide (TPR) repeat protein